MEQVSSQEWSGVGGNGVIQGFKFSNDSIHVSARWACFVERDKTPSQLYVFDAKQVTIGDVKIRPPSSYDGNEIGSEITAYYFPCENVSSPVSDGGVIIYYMDKMDECAVSEYNENDNQLTSFINCFAVLELHELTHWGVPVEDNEQDPEHWESWNQVLRSVVGYVNGVDTWNVREYEVEKTESGLRTTVGDFVDVKRKEPEPETENVTLSQFCTQE